MDKGQIIAIITLILVIILTSLHFAFAAQGGNFYQTINYDHLFDQNMAFIIVITFLELVVAIVLLVDILCAKCLIRKTQTILFVLLLVFEFALITNISIQTSKAGILRDRLDPVSNGKLDTFWRVGVADSVISWLIKIPLLLIVTYFAIDHLDNVPQDAVTAPPTTERM